MLLQPIAVRFGDDTSGRTFSGYTDGRLLNGLICPLLPLDEVHRVLDVLFDRGDDRQHYTVIDDQHVRVHGYPGVAVDHVMVAELAATTDGDRWLFDCGGMWTFVRVGVN